MEGVGLDWDEQPWDRGSSRREGAGCRGLPVEGQEAHPKLSPHLPAVPWAPPWGSRSRSRDCALSRSLGVPRMYHPGVWELSQGAGQPRVNMSMDPHCFPRAWV